MRGMLGKLDRDLLRVHISARDFERALASIAEAVRRRRSTIGREAALLCAVVHYARPFSGNEGCTSAAAGCRPRGIDVAKELGTDLALHNRIVKLRSKFVAHSESQFFPASRIADGYPSP
jgi:hypothetical protein